MRDELVLQLHICLSIEHILRSTRYSQELKDMLVTEYYLRYPRVADKDDEEE